jgi:hypothetical protein
MSGPLPISSFSALDASGCDDFPKLSPGLFLGEPANRVRHLGTQLREPALLLALRLRLTERKRLSTSLRHPGFPEKVHEQAGASRSPPRTVSVPAAG